MGKADEEDPKQPPVPGDDGPPSLVDELGVQGLGALIYGKYGKIFSAAGRQSPVAELSEHFLMMHPPQRPLQLQGKTEDIMIHIDQRGVLLDELGAPKFIAGAKYNGQRLVVLGQSLEGTNKHFVAFEKDGELHRLLINGEPLTHDALYRMRNQTHDGELGKFKDISSE